jgi:hypothetical protein
VRKHKAFALAPRGGGGGGVNRLYAAAQY